MRNQPNCTGSGDQPRGFSIHWSQSANPAGRADSTDRPEPPLLAPGSGLPIVLRYQLADGGDQGLRYGHQSIALAFGGSLILRYGLFLRLLLVMFEYEPDAGVVPSWRESTMCHHFCFLLMRCR
jgi:hypothetical protein